MTEVEHDLPGLLEFLRDLRGFDFTGYKPSTLGRRIRKRMQDVGKTSFADYRDLLETDPDEFTHLFNTILINVTSFFRDKEAWDLLRTEVIPPLVRRDGDIRVWSAGCSSGEEAYSLAIAFVEALGIDDFTSRVKIYATDVDEDALAAARKGVYTQDDLERVPDELRTKYFEPNGASFVFRPDVRRRVIFGRLDLINDAPISGLDLLCCRNTLMYFNADTQNQLIGRMHFALRDGGVLFLGKAEMLMANGSRFTPLSMPFRLFRCRPGSHSGNRAAAPLDVTRTVSREALRHRQLRDLAIELDPLARVVVDNRGNVVLINATARSTFGLTERDVGRPLRDLELSYRPIELRSLIEQAQSERRALRMNAVERRVGADETQYLDVQITPAVASDGVILGSTVTFTDSTSYVRLQEEVKTSREELETAYEELQSTNEELETTNEELQSTNEELETMNDELRVRSSELDEVNAYLTGVLASVPVGVIVLDGNLKVRTWNHLSEEVWGLRTDEVVGEQFFALDLGLPTGSLRDPVRAALETSTSTRVDIEAVNRRGQSVLCTITCTPLAGPGEGIVLLLEAHRRD